MDKSNIMSVYGALVLIQVLFGINFATSKVIVSALDPFIWSNIRFLSAGVLMLFFTLVARRKHPKVTKDFFKVLIPLSLLGMALGQGLFLFGLKYTSSINTAIITTMIPILTAVVVILRKQEEMTLRKFIGIVVAFVGVVLIRDLSTVSFDSNTFLGDLMVFLGGLCFALYLTYGKKFIMSHDNMWVTTWMFLISGISMTLYNIPKWSTFTPPEYTSEFIASASFTIIGATLVTYFLNNWALKKAASGSVALFIYLQPIVAGLIGWHFLHEDISARMVVSSIMILTGLVISIYSQLGLDKTFKRKSN